MAVPYKLEALYELRTHAVRQAEQDVALATARLRECERQQAELDDRSSRIRQRLAALTHDAPAARVTAAILQSRARFAAVLEADATHAEGQAHAHRSGALSVARRELELAKARHVRARQEQEVVARHREEARLAAEAHDERQREDDMDAWLRSRRSPDA